MYIYHKQYEIMQKIQWSSSNGQLHWFLIDFLWKLEMVHNGPNLCKRKRFFLCFKKISELSRVCHMKADVLPVPKICGCFLCYNFLNGIYCCPKSGQISRFFLQSGGVKKNKYAFNFEFLTSIFNQGGSDRYVLRLIERQNLKRKIVAIFIFFYAA